jgi:hypothetical protein
MGTVMRDVDGSMGQIGSSDRMRAAGADLLRAYRMQNIVVIIVGIELAIATALQLWSLF